MLAVVATLTAGARRAVARAPCMHAQGVARVDLHVDARDAKRVLAQPLARVVASKAVCAARCTLARVPDTVAVGEMLQLTVELRCVRRVCEAGRADVVGSAP